MDSVLGGVDEWDGVVFDGDDDDEIYLNRFL